MSLAIHAETEPEPRTRPLKAPAKKSAAKKTAAKKSAARSSRPAPRKAAAPKAKPATSKAKPATSKAKPPAATAKPAASRGKPAASKAKPAGKTKPLARGKPESKPRFRPAPRPKEAPPAEAAIPIPAELLEDGPKLKKPRKPRGKKAAVAKPVNALDIILAQLDDAKAEQIVAIPLDDRRAVADAVVVASGRSNRHVGAIADQLVQKLKEKGYRDLRIEGMPQCDWVLVDAGDVVVHIFRPEVRSFYNLEKLLSASAPDDRAVM